MDGTKIAGAAMDECRLRSAQRGCPEEACVQPDGRDPLGDQPGMLPRRRAPVATAASGEPELARPLGRVKPSLTFRLRTGCGIADLLHLALGLLDRVEHRLRVGRPCHGLGFLIDPVVNERVIPT